MNHSTLKCYIPDAKLNIGVVLPVVSKAPALGVPGGIPLDIEIIDHGIRGKSAFFDRVLIDSEDQSRLIGDGISSYFAPIPPFSL